jgi:hypothetical protein
MHGNNQTMNSLLHTAKTFAFLLAGWLFLASSLFAKEGTTTEPSGGGSWVLSYFLVGLAVTLGLLVVCRSSSRRDRIKPEAYAEKSGHGKEDD